MQFYDSLTYMGVPGGKLAFYKDETKQERTHIFLDGALTKEASNPVQLTNLGALPYSLFFAGECYASLKNTRGAIIKEWVTESVPVGSSYVNRIGDTMTGALNIELPDFSGVGLSTNGKVYAGNGFETDRDIIAAGDTDLNGKLTVGAQTVLKGALTVAGATVINSSLTANDVYLDFTSMGGSKTIVLEKAAEDVVTVTMDSPDVTTVVTNTSDTSVNIVVTINQNTNSSFRQFAGTISFSVSTEKNANLIIYQTGATSINFDLDTKTLEFSSVETGEYGKVPENGSVQATKQVRVICNDYDSWLFSTDDSSLVINRTGNVLDIACRNNVGGQEKSSTITVSKMSPGDRVDKIIEVWQEADIRRVYNDSQYQDATGTYRFGKGGNNTYTPTPINNFCTTSSGQFYVINGRSVNPTGITKITFGNGYSPDGVPSSGFLNYATNLRTIDVSGLGGYNNNFVISSNSFGSNVLEGFYIKDRPMTISGADPRTVFANVPSTGSIFYYGSGIGTANNLKNHFTSLSSWGTVGLSLNSFPDYSY